VFFGQTTTNVVLTVSTTAGCIGKDSARITVHQGNFASLVGPVDTGICPRDTIRYHASGGVLYNWSPAIYLNNPTSPDAIASPVTDVLYRVYVTDTNGCYDTLYSNLDVHPAPVFFLPDSVVLYPGDSVQFNSGTNAMYHSWFPPAGLSASNISNPVARPEVDTRYFVTGTTEFGCVSTDSVDVLVRSDSRLTLPNAFVPGSGPNGEFKILRQGLATLRYFRIFNRWGTKVFETTNIEKGWDGTFNGEPQPMGVYIYDVDAVTNAGRRFTQQGNITLIR
jgi:gliding motility-associated-like protein